MKPTTLSYIYISKYKYRAAAAVSFTILDVSFASFFLFIKLFNRFNQKTIFESADLMGFLNGGDLFENFGLSSYRIIVST